MSRWIELVEKYKKGSFKVNYPISSDRNAESEKVYGSSITMKASSKSKAATSSDFGLKISQKLKRCKFITSRCDGN